MRIKHTLQSPTKEGQLAQLPQLPGAGSKQQLDGTHGSGLPARVASPARAPKGAAASAGLATPFAGLAQWPAGCDAANGDADRSSTGGGLFSPDLRSLLASPASAAAAWRGPASTEAPAAGAAGNSRESEPPLLQHSNALPGEPNLVLASPYAQLPSSVNSLLASPDFHCTFAPPSAIGRTAGAAAGGTLAAPGLPPLFATPLLAQLTSSAGRAGTGGSTAGAAAAMPPPLFAGGASAPGHQAQRVQPQPAASGPQGGMAGQPLSLPRFNWLGLPPAGASTAAGNAGNATLVPIVVPFSAPTPAAAASSPAPTSGGTSTVGRKGSGGSSSQRQHNGTAAARARGRKKAATAAPVESAGSQEAKQEGVEDEEEAVMLPHMATHHHGYFSPQHGLAGLEHGGFGLPDLQALMLAPLLLMSPRQPPLPAASPMRAPPPQQAQQAQQAPPPQQAQQAQLPQPPLPPRQQQRTSAPAGLVPAQGAAKKEAELRVPVAPATAGSKKRTAGELKAAAPASAPADGSDAPSKRLKGSAGAAKKATLPVAAPAAATGAAAAARARSGGSTDQQRRRAGRKSAAPRKADAAGHAVRTKLASPEAAVPAAPQAAAAGAAAAEAAEAAEEAAAEAAEAAEEAAAEAAAAAGAAIISPVASSRATARQKLAAAAGAAPAAPAKRPAGKAAVASAKPPKPRAAKPALAPKTEAGRWQTGAAAAAAGGSLTIKAGKKRPAPAAAAEEAAVKPAAPPAKKQKTAGGAAPAPARPPSGKQLEQRKKQQDRQPGSTAEEAPAEEAVRGAAPLATAAGAGLHPAPSAAPLPGRHRAAAVAAAAGIKACAAAEGSRSPRATHAPFADSTGAAAAAAAAAESDSEEEEEEEEEERAPRRRSAPARRKSGGAGGQLGARQRRSRTIDGRRKDPAKVAAAILSRQRKPGQLTRVQRFAYKALLHLAPQSSVMESEVRRTFGNNPDVSKALRQLAEQGKVVRQGGGGRGTPFCWSATDKGREAVEEARQKLAADEALLAGTAGAAASGPGVDGTGTGAGSSGAAGEAAAGGDGTASAPTAAAEAADGQQAEQQQEQQQQQEQRQQQQQQQEQKPEQEPEQQQQQQQQPEEQREGPAAT